MALKWKARWISYGQHPAEDLGVSRFRRKFQHKGSEPLTVKVSADQRYQLFVNDTFVGDGPQRGDLLNWFYETYDLTDHLVNGENTVEAIVWSFGRYAPMAQHTYRLAFVLEGEGVSTPDGWEVARVKGHDFEMMHNEVGGFYIDVGPGEVVSTAHEPLEWKKPNVVTHVLERGEWAGDSPWLLMPRTLPPMKRDPWEGKAMVVDRETNDRKSFDSLMIHPGEKTLLDFGELLAAYPQFEFEGSTGTIVKVTYGEGLFDKDGNKNDRSDVRGKSIKGYQDRFVLGSPAPIPSPSSEQTAATLGETGGASTLWWRTWRYVQIESDQPMRLKSVKATQTGYPYEVESSFTADDPWVEKIWDVGLRTAKLCAGETYFDCPYYEQLQYVGDTRIQALIHCYLSRDRRLPRNAITQFERSILPNGLTQSRFPSRVVQIIPTFSLWWIQMIVDQFHYDVETDARLRLKGIAVLSAATEWIKNGPEFWPFSDWVEGWPMGIAQGGRSSTLVRLLHNLSAVAISHLSGAEHGPGGIPAEGRAVFDQMLRHVTLQNGLRKHDADQDWKPSEHVEALYRLNQIALGHNPDPWPTDALAHAKADKCTYYFQFYKHLAMQAEDYLAELEPWKEMIRNGLTTFAEAPEPTRSDCHAWSAHPLLGFFQQIAGVTSAAPSWKKARIAPKSGKLKHFEAKIAHPEGDLSVSLDKGRIAVDSPVPFEFAYQGKSASFGAGRHQF